MPNAQFDFIPDPVGNHADFKYRPPNHLLLVHEEILDRVEDAVHLRKRLGLVLQHLAANGRTSIVKGCSGVNQGWRRSPLGRNRGMQYYLWRAPGGSRPATGAELGEEHAEGSIWIRAVRRHHDHTPLTIGRTDSDYYLIGQNDIASHDDTFISPPDTEDQPRFVSDHGSGKTTALWKAIEARDDPRVLYLSWSRELTNLAEQRLSTFAPSGVSVTTRDFLTLLGEICGYDVERVAYERSRAAFGQALARTRSRPNDLGVWATRENALHAEIRAVLLGRAIPGDPDSTHIAGDPSGRCLPRLTDAGYIRIRGGRKGVGDGAAKSLLTIAERLERHAAAELDEAFPELAAAAESVRRLRRGHLPRGFDDFDRIVVDEVQDLTLVELAVVIELCRAIGLRRRSAPWLLIAISRATENLAFIEIAPDDTTQMSSISLLGDAATYSPEDLVEYLTNTDMLPDVMLPELIGRVGELIDTAPGRAWQLAVQAVHLLGAQDSPGAVSDDATHREAHTTLLSTAARMLVDGLPARVSRGQFSARDENSAALMGGKASVDAFSRLDEWTQDRQSSPHRLLDAALSLEADEDWLRDALPPVSQAVRDSIERCAADVVEAEHFAGDVEGWLELSGYRGDFKGRARDLRSRAATTLLQAGRVEQAERVISNVRPEDMLLNALYMEKSGRKEEAATLYERPGSIADANRVRADAVRDLFQQFARRGGIASSNINRLSSDERRLIRAARRAVPCPSCGAEVGLQCMGSGGSPNSDSHVERRRLSASLSFEYLAASPAVMEAAAALWGPGDAQRPSDSELRQERVARRAVSCPRCGAGAGRQCVTPSGSPYPDSHVERRQAAGLSRRTARQAGDFRHRG